MFDLVLLVIRMDSWQFFFISNLVTLLSWGLTIFIIKRKNLKNVVQFPLASLTYALPILWIWSQETESLKDKLNCTFVQLLPILVCMILGLHYLVVRLSRKIVNKSGIRKWNLVLTSPSNFPICQDVCQVKPIGFGNILRCAIEIAEKTSLEVVTCKEVGKGIGQKGNCTKDCVGWGFPNSVNLIWTSKIERKKYVASVDFCEEELATIKHLLETGYEGIGKDNPQPYQDFAICCLPGGQLRFFLYGEFRRVCLDFYHQAETLEMNRKKWEVGVDYTRDIPYGLWDNYFRRYNYTIKASFREKNGRSIYSDSARFTNGEFYERNFSVNPTNVISSPSVVMQYSFQWLELKRHYEFVLMFNEENIFAVFDKAFRDHPDEEALLQIIVEKDNQLNVSLNIGQDSYKLSSLEFIVLKFLDYQDEAPWRNFRSTIVRSNYLMKDKKAGIWQGEPKNNFRGA